MPEKKTGGYCKNCEKDVVIFRKGTNHLMHVLLALLTAGLWLIVWLIAALKYNAWRCSQCGSKRTTIR